MTDLRSSFEEIAVPLMDILYSGALRLTRDAEGAKDLLQETYLRAYGSFAQFEIGTNCKAWMFKIMYSIFLNDYRKKHRKPKVIRIEDVEKQLAASEEDSVRFLFEDNKQVIEHALNLLPEDFRMAVLLVDVEGCTYEEVASVLDCPVGTIRSRLYRARKILHLALFKHAKSRGYLKGSK
ncbi:sigma-70 family RNA polymerase sigma factor [bacterium]|nr:sigma-70 family RNA polymerase sigma factor [bacterium]